MRGLLFEQMKAHYNEHDHNQVAEMVAPNGSMNLDLRRALLKSDCYESESLGAKKCASVLSDACNV